MKPEEIAQWVIDNRYPKSEQDKVSDAEMYHFLCETITKQLQQHNVMPSLPLETLNVQIAFAQQKQIDADESGDEKGEEAWYGYLNALRWVESELKRQ